MFFWPVILVGMALLIGASLLLLVVQPVSEASTEATSLGAPAPHRAAESGGFGEVDFTSSVSGMVGMMSGESQASEIDEMEGPEQPWEAAINRLLDSDEENDKVAAELASLAPTMPLEGQVEAIQHMVNLLDDEQYALARNMLLNPSLHPNLREVIFSDALDRPNSVKLPMLLALFGAPGHPLRVEAHANLQAVVGRDLGQDPGLWTQAIQQVLAQEAAEEAEAEADVQTPFDQEEQQSPR